MGYATHGLLDSCTSYGTQLFWPFSDVRVAWDTMSIVDPLFTVPYWSLLSPPPERSVCGCHGSLAPGC